MFVQSLWKLNDNSWCSILALILNDNIWCFNTAYVAPGALCHLFTKLSLNLLGLPSQWLVASSSDSVLQYRVPAFRLVFSLTARGSENIYWPHYLNSTVCYAFSIRGVLRTWSFLVNWQWQEMHDLNQSAGHLREGRFERSFYASAVREQKTRRG